ncbi:lysophospholipid acyltransferase family protein [Evtepia sp.]|uniref:lysophospholipid acyltransferase family protein n=1 Tax=Evtepia sp. TaxID=2773933 RepID=UPI003F1874BF
MRKYDIAYTLGQIIIGLASFWKPTKVSGLENFPEGPALICANHVHNSDPFYIVTSFPRRDRVWIMAKEEISHWPVVGPLLSWFGFLIWVKRGKSDVGAVKSALKALKGGEKLLIFPEGTRNDELGEGKTGAAMMAIRAKVPILPVHISGERGFLIRVKVRIGQPYLPFTEDRKATTEDYQRATDVLMEKIRALGEEDRREALP